MASDCAARRRLRGAPGSVGLRHPAANHGRPRPSVDRPHLRGRAGPRRVAGSHRRGERDLRRIADDARLRDPGRDGRAAATRWASKSPIRSSHVEHLFKDVPFSTRYVLQWADRFGDLGEVIGRRRPRRPPSCTRSGSSRRGSRRPGPWATRSATSSASRWAASAMFPREGMPAYTREQFAEADLLVPAPAPRGRDPPHAARREERAARARRGDRSAADRPRAARCQAPRRGAEPRRRADPRRERRLPDRPPRPERGRCARERDAPEADRRRDRRARRSGAARRGIRRGEPPFRRSARTR